MSLIHICELNGANPFDYLTELQRHATEVAKNPAEWMPWNSRNFVSDGGRNSWLSGIQCAGILVEEVYSGNRKIERR